MNVLPFLAVTFGGAAATLLLRRWPPISTAVGLLALCGATLAALAIGTDGLTVGGGTLVGSAYGRLFLALGAGSGTLVTVIALGTGLPRDLPAALLLGLGATGLAVSVADPTTAVAATIVAGCAGILVSLGPGSGARGIGIAARELRAIAVAGALVLLATAWLSRPIPLLAEDPFVFGLAYAAVAVGVAMRFGAIPFHLWVARVADAAPDVALPLLTMWVPAGLAIVVLTWLNATIVPLVPAVGDLGAERTVIVAIGLACLVFGAIAAWIQDDLEHVVGYAAVQDAGVVLLAIAALDPGVWSAARTWIVVLVVARTALAAWAVAIRARFGTRRIDDLAGWARRSPVLLLALVAIAVASIGLPGLVAFDARATIIRSALAGPLATIVLVAVFLPVLYYGRLFSVGLGHPTAAAAAVPDDRPRRPTVGRSLGAIQPTVAANRGLILAGLVLVLASVAVATSAGGFGLTAAAAEAAPFASPSPAAIAIP
ncbi:MAG: proton-conducting transporter transmembrane domain-containing protein [Candidatus Limnocylindrales bacterium]